MTTSRIVFGSFLTIDGSVYPNLVIFTPTRTIFTADGVHFGPFRVLLAADGSFSIRLVCTDQDLLIEKPKPRYLCRAGLAEKFLFDLPLEDGSPIDFAALRS